MTRPFHFMSDSNVLHVNFYDDWIYNVPLCTLQLFICRSAKHHSELYTQSRVTLSLPCILSIQSINKLKNELKQYLLKKCLNTLCDLRTDICPPPHHTHKHGGKGVHVILPWRGHLDKSNASGPYWTQIQEQSSSTVDKLRPEICNKPQSESWEYIFCNIHFSTGV